jgi:two-component system, LytTR family, sensor kinase
MTAGAPVADETGHAARPWLWLQLLIGWLPIWALYVALMLAAHGGSLLRAALTGSHAIGAAAVLSLLLVRLVNRLPWPRPITMSFVLTHCLAAMIFAPSWVALTTAIESLLRGHLVTSAPPPGWAPFIVLGLWLYAAVVGVLYAVRATARAGRAEAAAAQSQLAALRSHLNPHFLFNALHTVVQLIPVDPTRASGAAEELAGLLRTALEEDRDVVPLREERAFVERYLALEHIRFGDRLQIAFDVDPAVLDAFVPAFVLQTLVENAVRHGASPNVDPTSIRVAAHAARDVLTITVTDTGVGARASERAAGAGTGLARLRVRLDALYGTRGQLQAAPRPEGGYVATVTLPLSTAHRG